MKRIIISTALLVTIAAAHLPFFCNLAGDAQVHLAIAEKFSNGHPFLYNITDRSPVIASTSPFWTLMLIASFSVFGTLTPFFLKAVCIACWAGTGFLLRKTALEIFIWSPAQCNILLAVWLTSSTIISNALGGLENILSALQVLMLYYICFKQPVMRSPSRSVIMGILLGWSLLTRPDGGFFAGIIVLFSILQVSIHLKSFRPAFRTLIAVGLVSVAVLLPWYCYQYYETGRIISDSALARFYTGRRTSITLLDGILYFHPKPIASILAAFLPLFLGILALTARFLQLAKTGRADCSIFLEKIHLAAGSAVFLAGLVFYSFIVGADHFGRYFLPVFPFLFLLGFEGLWLLSNRAEKMKTGTSLYVLTLSVIILSAASGADFYRRAILRQHFSLNLLPTAEAPLHRKEYTDKLLSSLGESNGLPTRIAVTEVQLRYFVDDRIHVISLDGRTCAEILKFMDRNKGIPDFEKYFESTKPDYVELGQWEQEGGWLSMLKRKLPHNLMADWEERARGMKPGECFGWNGHNVILVLPGVVRIDWTSRNKLRE